MYFSDMNFFHTNESFANFGEIDQKIGRLDQVNGQKITKVRTDRLPK